MDEDDLYDAYLDRVLEGTAEEPSAFLARHPDAGPELRARIVGLHRMAVAAATGPAHAGAAAAESRAGVARATSADDVVAPPPPAPPADVPWERLGSYRLLRRIGSGGMGAVFLAEDEALRRPVALKVLRPDLEGSAAATERFRREARAVARLRHPSIVTLFGAGEDAGVRWLAMEFVPGRGLDEILSACAESGRAPVDAVRWAAQLARALDAAHAENIVHRDVKPSNVRITPDGRAMLLDFGIARDVGADLPTLTGPFVGSPVYAAPEQVAGGAVDPRTDVYGLGATLYECLAGRPPHEAGTMEAVLRRVLTEEPEPLRRRNPSISRDLGVVVAKAMEKDPARRYATAGAFADDLEAVLSFRPIVARPPGAAERAWKWARRNPAVAAAAATCLAAVVGAAGWLVADDVARSRAARRDAAAAVQHARERVGEYESRRRETTDVEARVLELEERITTMHLDPEAMLALSRERRHVDTARRAREEAFYEVLDLLRRAEQLDPDVEGAQETRAALYLEKWREARAARDRGGEEFYRDLVRRHDPGGRHEAELAGLGTLVVETAHPGAEVLLFRYVEHGDLVEDGGPRQVPTPVQATPPAVTPGTVAMEVVADVGDAARRGDVILQVGGRPVADLAPADARAAAAAGARVRIWREGVVSDADLPPGGAFRVTASPLLASPACRVDAGPPAGVTLPESTYLVLVRAPGREPLRRVVRMLAGSHGAFSVELHPDGTTPPGFVAVRRFEGTNEVTFWMLEREVTAAEYLAFLNDPRTLAEIDASKTLIRVPRNRSNVAHGGHFPRTEGGGFALPDDWRPDWPALGLSYDDATAYARWYDRRLRESGSPFEASIPTFDEWLAACQSGWRYVYGDRFVPGYAKSCYSRPKPGVEPVMSYPTDVAPSGVHDLSGSVTEWSASLYLPDAPMRRVTGGNWSWAKPEQFGPWGGFGLGEDVAGDEFGFRIVLRRREAAR